MKRLRITSLAALLLVAALGGAWAYTLSSESAEAARIVQECSSSAGDRAHCYETMLPALYPAKTVSEVFAVLREVRAQDTSYQFCHVAAHKVGERVVAEDPDRWVDAIPLNPPDGLCSNGFIHGVVGGRFRAEVLDEKTLTALIPDFKRACEARADWSPSDLDRAICYHGLGHLYDFITDADIPKALEICDATVPPSMSRVCVEGVFMQIYQPLEPDDFLMIERMEVKPATTTVRAYCARYIDDEHEGGCLRESWPYFREAIMDGSGAEAFCSGQPNADEERKCYESIASIVGRVSLGDAGRAADACEQFPTAFRSGCFVASAQALLEENRSTGAEALLMCDRAGAGAMACKEALAARARFIFGDTEYRDHFCGRLQGGLRALCLRQ